MKALWRIVRIGMLVAVLGLMTLGPVTSAQGEERGSERSEEDCEAIGLRLREDVLFSIQWYNHFCAAESDMAVENIADDPTHPCSRR